MENLKLASLEDGNYFFHKHKKKVTNWKMQLIVAEMLVEEGDNSSPAAMADDKRSKRMKRSKVNKSCVFDMPTSNEFSQEKVCHFFLS